MMLADVIVSALTRAEGLGAMRAIEALADDLNLLDFNDFIRDDLSLFNDFINDFLLRDDLIKSAEVLAAADVNVDDSLAEHEVLILATLALGDPLRLISPDLTNVPRLRLLIDGLERLESELLQTGIADEHADELTILIDCSDREFARRDTALAASLAATSTTRESGCELRSFRP